MARSSGQAESMRMVSPSAEGVKQIGYAMHMANRTTLMGGDFVGHAVA